MATAPLDTPTSDMMARPPRRGPAFHAAAAQPWAIQPAWLQTILSIASREGPGPEAVAAQLGRPLENTHAVTVRDGVATIPIVGPIMRYASLLSEISGATSIEELALDLQAALDEPSVTAIVLSIDSPGGQVSGTAELADMVYAARPRKRMVAYISNLGASAAYWLASAASEVVVATTAMVGSIGVVAAMPDPHQDDSGDIQFVSSQSPKKVPDPTTEAGASQLQGMVDALAAEFIRAVARNRDVAQKAVREDFGQGDVLVGQAAVKAGLADRVGSYESVVSALATKGAKSGPALLRPARKPAAALTGLPILQPAAVAGLLAPVGTITYAPDLVNAEQRLRDVLALQPFQTFASGTGAPAQEEPMPEDAPEMLTAELIVARAFDVAPDHRAVLEAAGVTAEMAAEPALRLLCVATAQAQAEISRLAPLADDGKAYRADLLEETLAEGVRAKGDKFRLETHRALLANASLAQIKDLRDEWREQGDAQFQGGRLTGETEPESTPPPAGPRVPNAAFAG